MQTNYFDRRVLGVAKGENATLPSVVEWKERGAGCVRGGRVDEIGADEPTLPFADYGWVA